MMSTTYSPDLIPAVSYPSAREGIDFLKNAFGFEEHLIVPGEGDAIVHAELRLGRGILMCGDAGSPSAERNWTSPGLLGNRHTGSIYVAVPDPDERLVRARAAGATITTELYENDYGSRDFAAVDPAGNRWSFGTYHPLAEVSGEGNPGAGLEPELFAATRYTDALAAIAFLCDAFGFERHVVYADGPVVHHAQLRYGSSLFMLGSTRDDGHQIWTPAQTGGTVTETYYLIVQDVDASFERAKAAGATIVTEPRDTGYGSRDYAARDTDGHLWFIGSYRPQPLPVPAA